MMRGVMLALVLRKRNGPRFRWPSVQRMPVPLANYLNGVVAQRVERRITNPCDVGSTPTPATIFKLSGHPVR